MLGGDFKPLGAPLLKSGRPMSPSNDEWDCRGFEAKPLTGGYQMVHDNKKVAFLTKEAVNDPQTWANAMSEAAVAELKRKQRQLLKAIAASAIVMLVELLGGIYANSLALLSDSAHMLADIASYCIALVALQVQLPMDVESAGGCGPKEAVQQKLSKVASFGLHRVEVLGGLGSILIIWFTAGGLLYEGVYRLVARLCFHDERIPDVDGAAFVLVAACGLVFNALILYLFRDVAHGGHDHHDHSHSQGPPSSGSSSNNKDDGSNMTARAAIVHAMGDIAQSIGMLITACLITLNGERWAALDPFVTILCSLYMLYGTLTLLQEIFLVLIEATPLNVDAHAVRDVLRKRREVHAIRCFHVWALAPGKIMLTACVQCTEDCEDTDDVLRELQMVCKYKFGIHHATFQVTKDASLM